MNEEIFSISYVAKILDTHPQTIRQYEKQGLITPKRGKGKVRIYTNSDIEKLKAIVRLTRELGVNLAGIDIILRLKEDILRLENTIEDMKDRLKSINCVVPKEKSLVSKNISHKMVVVK
jgi:MerR family transcriptional regulator/heat shock protein HspR